MIQNLKIIGIFDNRTDNERICLEVINRCELGYYSITDTTYETPKGISNKFRHIYSFDDIIVNSGDYVNLYTKKGTNNIKNNSYNTKTYNFYWGVDSYVWNNSGDKAFLIYNSIIDSMEYS